MRDSTTLGSNKAKRATKARNHIKGRLQITTIEKEMAPGFTFCIQAFENKDGKLVVGKYG